MDEDTKDFILILAFVSLVTVLLIGLLVIGDYSFERARCSARWDRNTTAEYSFLAGCMVNGIPENEDFNPYIGAYRKKQSHYYGG